MERDCIAAAEKNESNPPARENINEDTCRANARISRDGTCGTTDVAKARWTLLRQVLK